MYRTISRIMAIKCPMWLYASIDIDVAMTSYILIHPKRHTLHPISTILPANDTNASKRKSKRSTHTKKVQQTQMNEKDSVGFRWPDRSLAGAHIDSFHSLIELSMFNGYWWCCSIFWLTREKRNIFPLTHSRPLQRNEISKKSFHLLHCTWTGFEVRRKC